MRRRFTFAIVGVVAGALLVAGVGAFVLLTLKTRRDTRSDVKQLAVRVAQEASTRGTAGAPTPALRPLQNFLKDTQRLTLVIVRPAAILGALPPGVPASALDPTALRGGTVESGFHGRTAYAAAPFTVGATRLAAVVSQQTTSPGGAGLYLVLAGGVALVAAFVVAETLARRITDPLVTVEQAAGTIAHGDFSARAPAPRESYPELTSLTTSINAMAANLERLREQERQFLLSVSHELRTPLTSIRGFAEALADGVTTDTAKAADVIASESRRLERLVRDLLDMAKLDAHEFTLDVRPVDLGEVVSDTADGFGPTAEKLGVRLHLQDPGQAITANADPDRLAQVVANLMENACKYAGGTVVVALWSRDGRAVVTVDDDGPGIPPAELPRVFDRLWTNSRGAGRQVGSGLGLAIVAELVAAMGGTVRAQSPVPDAATGTRMIVSLPAAPSPARGSSPAA